MRALLGMWGRDLLPGLYSMCAYAATAFAFGCMGFSQGQVQGQCLGWELGFAFGKRSARGGGAHLNKKVISFELFLFFCVSPTMAAVDGC